MIRRRLITENANNIRINRAKITRKQKWKEKQLYRYHKQQISEISYQKIRIWLRKGNFTRETQSFLIAAQNNTIRTNYAKAKIDKMQQNSKCRLCDDRDKTINHISKWGKLAQKEYKLDTTGWESDPLGVVWKIEIWPHKQVVYAQPRIRPGEWDAQTFLGFWDTNRSLNLGQTTRLNDNQ